MFINNGAHLSAIRPQKANTTKVREEAKKPQPAEVDQTPKAKVPGDLAKVYFGGIRFGNESAKPEGAETNALKDIIGTSLDKTQFEKLTETISFGEYMQRIQENPKIVRTSAQRIYDMVMNEGREKINVDGETMYRYKFFTNPIDPDNALSGMDKPIHKLMQVFEGAADQSGPDKRIILLVGPVGTAKTTMVKIIKQGMENYTRSDEGAMYGLVWDLTSLKDNPAFKDLPPIVESEVHDDPFNLIPNMKAGSNARETVVKHLNQKIQAQAESEGKMVRYHLSAKGDVSPPTKDIFNRLMKHYNGDVNKVLEHAKAKRVVLDEDERVGLTTYEPRDEKSHDINQLTGSVNFRKLMQSGKDSDPHAFDFDGELSKANRGLAHFDEILKLPKQMLYPLLTAAQDRKYKPDKFAQVFFDGVLIGTTNMPEWNRVRKDLYSEAIRSRIVEIQVPYNNKVIDEKGIYKKGFEKAAERKGIHVAPHAVEMASLWAVMTRLAEPPSGLTMLQKAKLYNGQEIKDITAAKVRQMKKDVPLEAMELLKGISPRDVESALSATLSHPDVTDEDHGTRSVSPFLVLDTLEAQLDSGVSNVSPQEKETFRNYLKVVEQELERALIKDVRRAIAGNEEELQNLFDSYKNNVFAWRKREKIKDPVTGRMGEPNEEFMKSLELKMGITDSNRETHRTWFIEQFSLAAGGFTYKTNDKMREALEDVLIEKHRDANFTLPDPATASTDELKKLDIVRTRLKDMGYNDHTADIAMAVFRSPTNRGKV